MAMDTFSFLVYPEISISSILSRRGAGMVERVLAVAMNSTSDRSYGTSR